MTPSVRGYIFSRPFAGERVPQHVQNLVIRDYCQKQSLNYLLSATEYAMPDSYLMLEQVLRELPGLEGIVAYSLFQLPQDRENRCCVLERTLAAGKTFHFAVENVKVSTIDQADHVNSIWDIKAALMQNSDQLDLSEFCC